MAKTPQPPMNARARLLLIASIFAGTIVVDQITKVIARKALEGVPTAHYLGDTIRVELAMNTGAFLSLGAALDERTRFYIFTISVAIFLAAASWYLFKHRELGAKVTAGLSLLIAGGVGNLIDRVLFGPVTDFLNMGLGSLRTGIFNVADTAVVAGVVLLVLYQ